MAIILPLMIISTLLLVASIPLLAFSLAIKLKGAEADEFERWEDPRRVAFPKRNASARGKGLSKFP